MVAGSCPYLRTLFDGPDEQPSGQSPDPVTGESTLGQYDRKIEARLRNLTRLQRLPNLTLPQTCARLDAMADTGTQEVLGGARGVWALAELAREVTRQYLDVFASESADTDPPSGDPEPTRSETTAALVAWRRGVVSRWLQDPADDMVPLAQLAAMFHLEIEDIEILIMAAAPAIDPTVGDLYHFLWNSLHKRCADVGFVCKLLSLGQPGLFESLIARCKVGAPLRRDRLVLLEARRSGEESLDLNLADRRIRAADRVLDFLRDRSLGSGDEVDEALDAVCVRKREEVDVAGLGLPEYSRDGLLQLARSRALPVLLDGTPGAGKHGVAQALGWLLGKGVLSADLTALLDEPPLVLEVRLAQVIREARLGGDLVYLEGHNLPEMLDSARLLILRRAITREPCVVGTERLPMWAVQLTAGWPTIDVPLPDADRREELWRDAFEGDRRMPDEDALAVIARRYEMPAPRIRQAASEARRLAQIARRTRILLADLDRACRAHFAHQLSDLADLVAPAAWGQDDLILPEKEKEKFNEILLYAREHDAIYGDWGFAEKFPYGRGLSVLFYGPPGTGKTMGAMIIASNLGLDLFRVDLSRIISRYVGETEKNLARIFDEAERGKVMLLFDEADSLFTKRTEVKNSVDRYANLEVAYLLQRMENFEGVTVLTTNVEANLDDAFKRRIRYRIYFPMPDAPTRAELWKALIPSQAPLRANIPWRLLGKQFELTGGHIKQAVLRAGFYARRQGAEICLRHLVEGATAECREIGMLVSDELPKALAKAVAAEREQERA